MKKFANLCFEFSFDQVSPHFRHTAGIHWKHLFCFVLLPLSNGNYRKSLWVSLQQESSSSSSEVKNQKLLSTLVMCQCLDPEKVSTQCESSQILYQVETIESSSRKPMDTVTSSLIPCQHHPPGICQCHYHPQWSRQQHHPQGFRQVCHPQRNRQGPHP